MKNWEEEKEKQKGVSERVKRVIESRCWVEAKEAEQGEWRGGNAQKPVSLAFLPQVSLPAHFLNTGKEVRTLKVQIHP